MADKKTQLTVEKNKLRKQVIELATQVVQKENTLLRKSISLQKGAPGIMRAHFSGTPVFMMPGNVGDINKVIWPTWYATDTVTVAPNSQVTTGFTVSQTAGFIATYFSKAIYVFEDLGGGDARMEYVNPNDPVGAGATPGLQMNFRNSSSTRDYFDTAANMDHFGNPRWPTYLYSPQLIQPNSNVEVNFINNNPDVTYRVGVSFGGVRIRIEDAYNLLSTVSAEG